MSNPAEMLGMFFMAMVAMFATMGLMDDCGKWTKRIAWTIILLFGVPVLVKIWILGVLG